MYRFSTAGPGAAGRIYYEVANTKEGPNSVMRAKVEEYIPGVKLGLGEFIYLGDSWTPY